MPTPSPLPPGILPPPIAWLVAAIGQRRWYPAGGCLFRAGDRPRGIHVVLEGRVRVHRVAPTGRTVVVHQESAGGMLGELPVFDGGAYPATAEAVERTQVALLPSQSLLRAMEADPAVARLFLARLAGRLREVIGRLDAVATRSVAQRLARHLVARRQAAGSDWVSLGMSQVDLAGELGTVREVVVRELRQLAGAGILAPGGRGRYRITDGPALDALAR